MYHRLYDNLSVGTLINTTLVNRSKDHNVWYSTDRFVKTPLHPVYILWPNILVTVHHPFLLTMYILIFSFKLSPLLLFCAGLEDTRKSLSGLKKSKSFERAILVTLLEERLYVVQDLSSSFLLPFWELYYFFCNIMNTHMRCCWKFRTFKFVILA